MTTEMQGDLRSRPKLVPLVIATLLGAGLPILAVYIASISIKYLHTPSPDGPTLPWLYNPFK